MDLSNLKPAEGATKNKKRLGRGVGSGRGGHSSTKGTKGQLSRSGGKIPVWFEGGQMPLHRRLPKFGFKAPFRKENHIVNLSRIVRLIDEGRIDASEPITPEVLDEAGAVRKATRVKVLADGGIDVSIDISAHAFSRSAKEQIEAAGGSATVIE